jgi:hypothetical protein
MSRNTTTTLLAAAVLALGVDLALWAGHVVWRGRALDALTPIVERIEALEADISADEEWLGRNERLAQGYGRHREYAERLTLRAQRAQARAALVDAYNDRVRRLYRRFYLAPVRAPQPPLRSSEPTPR